MPGGRMAGKVKGKIVTLAKRKQAREGENMTVAELMHHNFDEIFIELDPVKREAMIRNACKEDCVWIHPGGRLFGIAGIHKAACEIRNAIPEHRYKSVGHHHTIP